MSRGNVLGIAAVVLACAGTPEASKPAAPKASATAPAAAAPPPEAVTGGAEACFGAIGLQCGQSEGPLAFCARLPGCGGGLCLINGASIEYDTCCHAHPDGAGCRRLYDQITPEMHCHAEYRKLVSRMTDMLLAFPETGREGIAGMGPGCGQIKVPAAGGWFRQVDFNERNTTGAVDRAKYCAPTGAAVHKDDEKYCCSGHARRLLPMRLNIEGFTVVRLNPPMVLTSALFERKLPNPTRYPLKLASPFADGRKLEGEMLMYNIELTAPGMETTVLSEGYYDMSLCTDAPPAPGAEEVVELMVDPVQTVKLISGNMNSNRGVLVRVLKARFKMSDEEIEKTIREAAPR